jgi:hypothetical protein
MPTITFYNVSVDGQVSWLCQGLSPPGTSQEDKVSRDRLTNKFVIGYVQRYTPVQTISQILQNTHRPFQRWSVLMRLNSHVTNLDFCGFACKSPLIFKRLTLSTITEFNSAIYACFPQAACQWVKRWISAPDFFKFCEVMIM